MEVRFVSADLRRFDEVRAEALALPLFLDARPTQGALGLVDWRLVGRVSDAVRRGRFKGAVGEHLLISGRPKLPFDKLFIYGAGAAEDFTEEAYRAATEGLFCALARAKVRTSVCLLPGREGGEIEPRRAMELLVQVLGEDPPNHDEVILVEDGDAPREMAPVIEQARRRVRARRSE
ncbi:MAG: hypothetical protein DRJ42_07470 [Deltaproteobacteria bacterium]|nr:MAG: hypothetical protein DRJ42_07470 [Deltaproteobacteria bacterium]